MNPFEPFLADKGYVVLDGGLSSELEQLGCALDHALWTAHLIQDQPEAIKKAHLLNLQAGADCIISSSYQASIPGLIKHGYSHEAAIAILKKSYHLAATACDEFYSELPDQDQRIKPIVAASIGPYGAYLADGSEYRGDYGLSVEELVAFHQERFDILSAESQLLAFETVPSYPEALAIHDLLLQKDAASWVSFSCKDGGHINDGQSIEKAASLFNNIPAVSAVGVNCTAPKYVSSLITRIKAACPEKEVVVYPNSGERFSVENKTWEATSHSYGVVKLATKWQALGARIIGGCCRVTATEIKRLNEQLSSGAKK